MLKYIDSVEIMLLKCKRPVGIMLLSCINVVGATVTRDVEYV